MIFALVDYWKYRRRRGKYSDASLEAAGWLRATEDNIQRMVADRRSLGQIFFTHPRRSLVSWAIMYAQGPGPLVSHVGIIVEEGNICEAIISMGVVRRPIAIYADGVSYFQISDFDIPPEDQLGVIRTAEELIGTPYHLSRIVRHAGSILSGWDRGGEENYSVYGDVLAVLSLMALPLFRCHKAARRAILLYLLVVSLGRFIRVMPHRGEWSRPQDLALGRTVGEEW